MTTIPASFDVSVAPGVLSGGGLGLSLNGMILTETTRVPIGTASQFPDADAVSDYFGASSDEYTAALSYFAGFDNSSIKPGNVIFAQYPRVAVAAFLRGAAVTGLSVAQLAALAGTLTITIDGGVFTNPSVSLSGATSYSNAASLLQTAVQSVVPTTFTSTSSSIAATTLTVAGTLTGTVALGQVITGSGITANSIVTAFGTGTGGAGTYTLSQSSTVSSIAIVGKPQLPTVTFDSTSGAFIVTSLTTGVISTIGYASGTLAPLIYLTSATGAVISQGAAAAVPATYMAGLTQVTQNWAMFMNLQDPDAGSGITNKEAFAVWNGLQSDRWGYVCLSNETVATVTVPATGSLGYILTQAAVSGTELIYDTVNTFKTQAFICGATASINFAERQGRITFKFKSQSGLLPGVTNQTVAANLVSNGYNFYGAYATAGEEAPNTFVYYAPGTVTGQFTWLDSYVNQIWLNNSFQRNILTFLTNVKSVPYTRIGGDMIESACGDTIQAGLNFGAFSPGVVLSEAQKAQVNFEAGFDVATILFQIGYYFQALPGSSDTRNARTSPPLKFWYTDPGGVHKINLASIALL